MKKSDRNFAKTFGAMLVVFLIPFVMIAAAVFAIPAVYDGTFLGELSVKYDRLREIEDKKIVVVAGSSSAFGLDSEMIESELGYDTVNFGLYANLGTKLMMDLSRTAINAGDIIILAPEMNSQTLSLYFNPETAAQALDGNAGMILGFSSDEYDKMIGSMWSLSSDKLYYTLTGKHPENAGAYKKENFNEYGDNVYPRPYSELTGFGNPIYLNFYCDLSDGVDGDYEEYIEYVNDYVAYARSKGAEVYFSFPPMNGDAVAAGSSDEDIDKFYKNLCMSLNCKIISNIRDYILDPGYFYDSEFHLNDSGVTVRTVQLIDDIKREFGDISVTVSVLDLPEPSGKRPDCRELELIKTSDGRGWTVKSLSEAGMNEKNIVIPDNINGLPVMKIATGAFSGCENLVSLTIGMNIDHIAYGAIDGCPNLFGIIIPEGVRPEHISIPDEGLGYGCKAGFAIYVAPADYELFANCDINGFKENRDIIAPNEGFSYREDGGTVAVSSLSESGKGREQLVIPAEHNGMKVTAIDEYAFEDAESLTELVIGENVRHIAENAFFGVRDLRIVLPEGVLPEAYDLPANPDDLGYFGDLKISVDWWLYDEFIESDKFSSYKDIITTDNLYLELEESDGGWTVVGLNERAEGLTELTIPDTVGGLSVTTIAEGAFDGSDIETLTLGHGIRRLDGGALRGSNVRAMIIPDDMGAEDISVPNAMSEALATDGCRPGLKIYVSTDKYSEFASDYFWGDYGAMLTEKE